MHIICAVVCGIIGLIVGVVSQPLVRRLPVHQSLRTTPHHCSNCGVDSAGVQALSLVARISRKRYCENCDVALYPKFPGLELFCVTVLAVVGLQTGWVWELPAYLVFFSALVLVTVIDMRHYMIPTRLIYPSLLATLILLGVSAVLGHHEGHFVGALIGMSAAWFFFFVVWFIYPAGMGFGDVRLSALIGLVSGYLSFANVIASILFGLLLGALIGVLLMIVRVRGRKQAIPFGPFLAAGAAISVLWGNQL